jgi:hypothetical protein
MRVPEKLEQYIPEDSKRHPLVGDHIEDAISRSENEVLHRVGVANVERRLIVDDSLDDKAVLWIRHLVCGIVMNESTHPILTDYVRQILGMETKFGLDEDQLTREAQRQGPEMLRSFSVLKALVDANMLYRVRWDEAQRKAVPLST